jgi:NarL family two-component system sensor histidine kinase LiaS
MTKQEECICMIKMFRISSLLKIKNLSAEMKAIYFYRYFSLILTSIFYLTGSAQPSVLNKAIVVGCLTIAAIIINNIYIKYETSKNIIRLMIAIEMIGNIVILIPSGGLNSPYIWYSLNTVLVTAYFLDKYYFIFNLLAYTTILSIMSFYFFNSSEKSAISFLSSNSNLILSYILIIFAIRSVMKLIKRLNKERKDLSVANEELLEANKMVDDSMEYIALLYQSIHNLINTKDWDKTIGIIMKYTREITKTNTTFFCRYSCEGKLVIELEEKIKDDELKDIILKNMKQNWEKIITLDFPFKLSVQNKEFIAISVKSTYEVYGVLGIEINTTNKSIIERENNNQLKLLASLSSILFERFRIEEMNRLLLISEEQNRIANEIHDSVCQKLFFISCKISSLTRMNNIEYMEDLNYELELVKKSINNAMKELREVIYGYSYNLNGSSLFEDNIEACIDEISKLNEANISFNIIGNQDSISYDLKKAIYRILMEGIGNAVNHGKSKNLNINLCVEKEQIKIGIEDDGIGFDLKSKIKGNNLGLGIRNLYSLVNSFNGNIVIKSLMGKGTTINVLLPQKTILKEGEIVV